MNEKPKSHFTWFVGVNLCYATDFKKIPQQKGKNNCSVNLIIAGSKSIAAGTFKKIVSTAVILEKASHRGLTLESSQLYQPSMPTYTICFVFSRTEQNMYI